MAELLINVKMGNKLMSKRQEIGLTNYAIVYNGIAYSDVKNCTRDKKCVPGRNLSQNIKYFQMIYYFLCESVSI